MIKNIFRHKVIIGLVIIFLVGTGYFGYKKLNGNKNTVSYVLATVEKGTIIASVSGSGQVSNTNKVDIKSKASGDVLSVAVADGQKIKEGTLLVKIDDSDAQNTIKNAQISYNQAKLDLQKMQGITNDLGSIQGIKDKALASLEKSYEDGFNDVSNSFLDLPNIMSGLNNLLFSNDINPNQWNIDYYSDAARKYDEKALDYRNDAFNKYQNARALYDKNFEDYKSINRSSDKALIESLINKTYETVKSISDAIKSENNLIQFYQDTLTARNFKPLAISNTHLSTLNTYTGKTNNFLSTLLSDKNTIQSNQESLAQTEYTIADQEIKIAQAEETLNNAKKNLEDYTIYAPFSGTITTVNIEKGNSVSSGTTIATLISDKQIGEITLNEVDAAKVKFGQKATISFDALPGFTISGEVTDIDTVGTVSQGVVSYGVKIAFDNTSDSVKSGMSITADIITDVKQDILVLPNSAVKSQGNSRYVELVENPTETKKQSSGNTSAVVLTKTPKIQTVETGLSNDTSTEIISGLKEGDIVVTSTISSNSSSNPSTTGSSSQNQIRIPGVGGFRGGD